MRGSRVDQFSTFSAIPGRLLWRNIFNIIHHVSSATASRSSDGTSGSDVVGLRLNACATGFDPCGVSATLNCMLTEVLDELYDGCACVVHADVRAAEIMSLLVGTPTTGSQYIMCVSYDSV